MIHRCNVTCLHLYLFFFNDTATTEIYTLSLHDALPISAIPACAGCDSRGFRWRRRCDSRRRTGGCSPRSEEHTSELQSRQYLVCRLLLEKKKQSPPHLKPPPLISSPSLKAKFVFNVAVR